MNYDIIKYDAGDVRNKSIVDNITKHNMSDKNVLSLFQKKTKKLVIMMDELDGMNSGDKGGINSLIKIIRPKNIETYVSEGEDWFSSAKKAGLEIPTGCLTGSCGACEIDVNGETIRACIRNIEGKKRTSLKVSLTTDPFWEA